MGPQASAPKEKESTPEATKKVASANESIPKKERKPKNEQVSSLTFAELDPLPTIADPEEGEPCGLYLEGLNYHWDGPRFEKFLKTKCEIPYVFASKKKSDFAGIIKFDNPGDRLLAYQKLVAARFGQKVLFVVPLSQNLHFSKNLCRRVRARSMNPNLGDADIRTRVTAWWEMPLEEQYKAKSEKFSKIIEKIVPEGSPNLPVIPVPNTSNYRNKVEMTVGRDLDGTIVVGFNLGSKDEDVVRPIDNCLNVPKFAPYLSNKFAKFISASKSPIYDRIENRGVWKFIVVRTTENGQSMLVVVTYGAADPEDIVNLTNEFKDDVTSLWYCETSTFESFGPDPKFKLLSGTEVIIETLRGLKFDISPMSFFQTNTPGAEILFQEVENLTEVDENTVLIDVCCGTGVIGLSLAKKAKRVIGIDIEASAIENAIKNAQENDIQNTEFIASPAEKVLPDILKKCEEEGSRVVVIVDPPRDGLHKVAARAIRDCSLLHKLVYISCNPESLVRDTSKILSQKDIKSTPPFLPTKWFGVDIFPHTPRLELVMLLERE